MKKVGALWKNKNGKNKDSFVGELDLGILDKVRVGVFPNDRKKNEREPDFNVVLFTDEK